MLAAATFTLGLVAAVSAAGETAPTLVQTTLGPVQGHVNELGMNEWKGLPYAKPPMGALRWQNPQSPEAWTEVYNADVNVNGCPQLCNLPPGNCPAYGTSEDCLYMSVFAPSTVSEDPEGYPVMFWIHGGAFTQGLGNAALYNGSTFAQNGVISVVINYRLGALGFMASESMTGNYGILDQRLAMEWTRDNIKAFGGNPNKVTIAGQSAGGMSVGVHLISPGSAGLFSASIQESNPLGLPFHTKESANSNAKDVFEYLGCEADDVECMMTKSADEIVDAQNHAIKLDFDTLLLNFLPFAPMVVPGGEIPEQPLTGLAAGNMKTLGPMMQGTMYDEGQLFVYELFTKPLSEEAYKIVVDGVFGLKASRRILQKYPFDIVPGSVDGREALNVLATDLIFYCPLRNVTQGYHKALGLTQAPSTYVYRFKHVLSFDCWGPDYQFCVGIACHGSELPFVFNVFTDGETVDYSPNEDEIQLTADMGNAWTNFIVNNNPNKGLPVPREYPLYVTATDKLVVQEEPDDASYSQDHVRDEFCDMWDSLGYFY